MTSTAYPAHIITADDLPEWEDRAAAFGGVLDYWQPFDGDEAMVARIVPAEEYERARSLRYLGLDPAQR